MALPSWRTSLALLSQLVEYHKGKKGVQAWESLPNVCRINMFSKKRNLCPPRSLKSNEAERKCFPSHFLQYVHTASMAPPCRLVNFKEKNFGLLLMMTSRKAERTQQRQGQRAGFTFALHADARRRLYSICRIIAAGVVSVPAGRQEAGHKDSVGAAT